MSATDDLAYFCRGTKKNIANWVQMGKDKARTNGIKHEITIPPGRILAKTRSEIHDRKASNPLVKSAIMVQFSNSPFVENTQRTLRNIRLNNVINLSPEPLKSAKLGVRSKPTWVDSLTLLGIVRAVDARRLRHALLVARHRGQRPRPREA